MTLDCSYRQRLGGERKPENRGRIIAFRPLFSVLRPPSAQPRAGARRRRRLLLKTSFASNTSRRPAVKQSPTTEMPLAGRRNTDDREQTESVLRQSTPTRLRLNVFPLHNVRERRTEDRGRITVGCRRSRSTQDAFTRFAKLKILKDISRSAKRTRNRQPETPSVLRSPSSVLRMVEPDGIEPTCLMLAKHALSGPEDRERTTDAKPDGGARRDRTDDLMLAKHALSQLSYSPAGGHPSSVVRLPSSDPGGPGRT